MTIIRSRREWVALVAVIALVLVGGCSSSDESGTGESMSSEQPDDFGAVSSTETFEEMPADTTSRDMGMSGGGMQPMAGNPQEAGEVAARRAALRERQQALASNYMKLGNSYFQEGRLDEARSAFANALEVQPDNTEAQRLFDRVSALLGEDTSTRTSEARDLWGRELAKRQQGTFLARTHLDRGHSYFTEGDYAKAIEEYEKALLIFQANPSIDAEFDEKSVRDALARAKAAKQQADQEDEAARIRDVERINAEQEAEARRKAERRVQRLWDEAVSLFERERFGEVETMCDQILDLDIQHPEARQLKEYARRARHEKANADNITNYRNAWEGWLQEIKDIGMPIVGDPIYPDLEKWREIAARGPIQISRSETQVSEMDEDVRRRLEGTILPQVDWTDKTLDEAIRFIRNNTNTNIVIMRAVEEAVPAEERTLALRLDDIDAYNALKLAVEYLKLTFQIRDGMVQITTPEAARGNKVVEFFEVRDLTAKLNSFPGVEINLNPSGFGAGVGLGEEDFEDEEENRPIEAERLIEMVRQAVDPVSWEEDPANTIVDKNGTLVVRQTPENQRQIRQLLADLRKSTGIQVMIESRFISVENNFLQDIGVDWRGLGDDSGGIGQPGLGSNVSFDDFGLPGTQLPIGTGTDAGAFYNNGSDGDIRARTENLFDVALGNPNVLQSTGGLGLQFTYLDDTELEAILRAVQKYERVNTVTAPTLLVYNTQRANLQVTNHVAYVKDFDVEIAQAAVIADPIIDVVKEGVILDVRPIVSNDRRFVTLELRPTVATLVRPLRTFSTTLGVGTAVTFEVPELRKESLKTTVVMPDGGTLLLGGLKFYEEQDIDAGVPVLKDIPVVSFLFSRKGKYSNMRDLIVLLRVKIQIGEELEPTVGAGG